jgi:catechol 2,3-dioxygenase-like lactoylglutathione lyase family enzyme
METSIAFYTNVLNFQCVEHGGDDDPSCSALMRGGSSLLLSTRGGDDTRPPQSTGWRKPSSPKLLGALRARLSDRRTLVDTAVLS